MAACARGPARVASEPHRRRVVLLLAHEVSDVAGDDIITATILARAIFREGNKMMDLGHNPVELKRGIDKAVDAGVAHIKPQSWRVTDSRDLANIGISAAGGDRGTAALIAEAVGTVGKDGVITVVNEWTGRQSVEMEPGMRLGAGYLSPYFVTDPDRMEADMRGALVLVCEQRISRMSDLLPLLNWVADSGSPLLVVAEDVEGEALATLGG